MKELPDTSELPVLDIELEPINVGVSTIFQELKATKVDIRNLLIEDGIGSDRTAKRLLNGTEMQCRWLNKVRKINDVMTFY